MHPTLSITCRRFIALGLVWLLPVAVQAQSSRPAADAINSAQVLFSGHSLIDNPLPEWVELIAKSKGNKIDWEQQNIVGSPVRVRTRGSDAESDRWDGYSYGKNRNSEGMNVITELRNGTRIGTRQPYDTLVLAENHGSLGTIIWENAIGYLRHFHDRLLDANPQGRTIYVHTWLSLDKNDPAPWIVHEKGASTVWQCMAEKVRLTLAAENRPANILVVPAGTALVALVEKALDGKVAGISGSMQQKLNRIFHDNVHLTDTGIYFVAAVHYASIYHQSPEGAAAPPTVPAELAKELQAIAWEVTRDFMAQERARQPSMQECRQVIVERVCRTYWSLANEQQEIGRCQGFFSQTNPKQGENPFVWPDPNWKPLPSPTL